MTTMNTTTQKYSSNDLDILSVEWDQVSEDLFTEFPDIFEDYSKNNRYNKLVDRFDFIGEVLTRNNFYCQASEEERLLWKIKKTMSTPCKNIRDISNESAQKLFYTEEERLPVIEKTFEQSQQEKESKPEFKNWLEEKNKKFEEHRQLFDALCSSKSLNLGDVTTLIKTNDYAVCTFLINIYGYQTFEEQEIGSTKVENSVGFNAYDAPFLTSLSEQYKSKGWLSDKQINAVRKTIIKYKKQILNSLNQYE